MKKMKNILWITIFVLAIPVSMAVAQNKDSKLRHFDYDIVATPQISQTRVETKVFIWLNNSDLQFVKSDSEFVARFQINLDVLDSKGTAVLTADSTLRVLTNNYAATIDEQRMQHIRFQFLLQPQEYQFKLRVIDLNSGKSMNERTSKNIPTFSKNELVISDVLLLSRADYDSITDEIVLSPKHVEIRDTIYVYALVYLPQGVSDLNVSLFKRQQKELPISVMNLSTTPPLTSVIVPLTRTDMTNGQSELLLKISSDGLHAEATKEVHFYGSIESLSPQSIDEKIKQLIYVARGEEWNNLRKAKGEDRSRLFKEFWARRDPTPNTPENELYNEYYNRVKTANEQYSSQGRPGWRTDRGHVFILYGQPDRVEKSNQSFNMTGDYEVWYYQELDKKFVFWDEYGFGDFKLVSGFIE